MTTPGTAPLVLAVDLGTSGCKCALVAQDGTVVAWAFRPVALHVEGVRAEQDPEAWWQALLEAAGEVLAADASHRGRVDEFRFRVSRRKRIAICGISI